MEQNGEGEVSFTDYQNLHQKRGGPWEGRKDRNLEQKWTD